MNKKLTCEGSESIIIFSIFPRADTGINLSLTDVN